MNEKILLEIASQKVNDVFILLKSSNNGLTEDEAKKRLKEFGFNEIAHEKTSAWYKQLFNALKNPFNILLLILAVISDLTGDLKAAIVLSFYQSP